MAVDMFMYFDKTVEGETTDSVYKDKKAIDILAWSWGVSSSTSVATGGGAGVGKANFQDLSFTHYFDKASPVLQMMCATGEHADKVCLDIRKAGGTQQPYLKITMGEAYVTAISTGGSGGEDKLTENVTLAFATMKIEYLTQDKTGKMAAAGDYFYNISENTKDS